MEVQWRTVQIRRSGNTNTVLDKCKGGSILITGGEVKLEKVVVNGCSTDEACDTTGAICGRCGLVSRQDNHS